METETESAPQPQIIDLAAALSAEPAAERTPAIAPMTYAQLFAALGELVPKQRAYQLSVQTWNWGIASMPIETRWTVHFSSYGKIDSVSSDHFASPHEVLEAARKLVPPMPPPAPVIDEAFAIGVVDAPASPPPTVESIDDEDIAF